jgi:hypothetical protein
MKYSWKANLKREQNRRKASLNKDTKRKEKFRPQASLANKKY